MRLNWRVLVLLPVAFVLLNGLLLFVLITLSVENEVRRPVLVLASAGAVAVCGAVLLAVHMVVRRPLRKLQEKIAMVRLGDLNAHVDFAHRNDDLGELGRDFNAMVSQLRESREEIQRLHRTQMSRAEHLATLGELAAGLAHEIRNPLAGIAGVIEVMARDLPPGSAARKVVPEVRAEVDAINRIVSQLLEIARPKPPEMRFASLAESAEQALLFAREEAAAKSVSLELVQPTMLPKVEHDPDQMRQVLLNLLLNAIQACDTVETGAITASGNGNGPRPGRAADNLRHLVRLEFGHDADAVWATVADSGQGIRPEILPNIFRPFFTTKGSGTGLGLPLVKRIVEDHGGRIEVESEPEQGSRFTVLLPLRKAS